MHDGSVRFNVSGTGWALPEQRLDNPELAARLGIDADSITERTGIVERRVASPGDSASGLGSVAAKMALERAGVDARDIDLVLLSTYTPDHLLCPTAPVLAHRVGALNAGAFDLNGACSGGVTALFTGAAMLHTGIYRRVLVVTADLTTRFIHPEDAKTALIFGDGATACLLEPVGPQTEKSWSVVGAGMGADGSGAHLFKVPAGGCVLPPSSRMGDPDSDGTIKMNGRAIFRFGVERGASLIGELCAIAGLALNEVDWVIPHQANLRIISALADRVGIPLAKWVINIQHCGNTASSSVPLAWAELMEGGRVSRGENVLLVAFGAGLTWSGIALRQL